jgi:hypothetical protein
MAPESQPKAIWVPSGDHASSPLFDRLVTIRSDDPSAFTIQSPAWSIELATGSGSGGAGVVGPGAAVGTTGGVVAAGVVVEDLDGAGVATEVGVPAAGTDDRPRGVSAGAVTCTVLLGAKDTVSGVAGALVWPEGGARSPATTSSSRGPRRRAIAASATPARAVTVATIATTRGHPPLDTRS